MKAGGNRGEREARGRMEAGQRKGGHARVVAPGALTNCCQCCHRAKIM